MLSLTLALLLTAEPMELIVWGGGKTPEAAQASLAELNKRKSEWSAYLTLQKGYPKIVESSKVEGLNAGFHIVVLGACFEPDVPEITALFKAFEPSIYQKTVKWPDGDACPDAGKSRIYDAQRVKMAGGELSAIVVSLGEATKVIARFDKKGSAPVLQNFEKTDCSGGDVILMNDGIGFTANCVTERCPAPASGEVNFMYVVKAGRIVESQKASTKPCATKR